MHDARGGMSAGPVRVAAQAGRFYTDDPRRLARQVDGLLASAAGLQARERARRRPAAAAGGGPAGEAPGSAPGGPLGLLVPHAGLEYSGGVAAVAWRTLVADPPDTIVIAGTNHGDPLLRGCGLWPAGSWEIPLGSVAVDGDLAARILALGPPFRPSPGSHRGEHSIEVQLPFVVRALPGSRIVPFLVAAAPTRECTDAGERLGALLRAERAAGARIVLAASSDLAHYPGEADALAVDDRMLGPLAELDPVELARREARVLGEGIPGLVCGLCGLHPTLFTLAALRAMGATHGEVLATATSADAGGGSSRCVGYAAVAFR